MLSHVLLKLTGSISGIWVYLACIALLETSACTARDHVLQASWRACVLPFLYSSALGSCLDGQRRSERKLCPAGRVVLDKASACRGGLCTRVRTDYGAGVAGDVPWPIGTAADGQLVEDQPQTGLGSH